MRRFLAATAFVTLLAASPPSFRSGRTSRSGQTSLTFAVTLTPGASWLSNRAPNDQPHMRLHSENLRRLRAEGHARLGGRFGAFGFVLIDAPDSATVAGMFAPDSAVQTGVFSIRIDQWRTFYDGCVE